MLHDRQQLEVREARLFHVRHQSMRQLAIRQEAIAFLGHARPRSEVDLVDRHRPIEPRVLRRAATHPLRVAPLIVRDVADERRGLRRHLEGHRERIALLQERAAPGPDLVLVFLPVGQIGNEDLPDAAGREVPHRVDATVPRVEVADHADAFGIRRPDREVHAGRRADGGAVRAELLERAQVRPLAEQVQIEVGEHAAVAIRIVDLEDVIARKRDAQPVVGHPARRRLRAPAGAVQAHLEQSRRIATGHRHQRVVGHQADADRLRRRVHRADDDLAAVDVRAERRERIALDHAQRFYRHLC